MTPEQRAQTIEHIHKLLGYMKENKIEDPMDALLAMYGIKWMHKSGAFVGGSNSQSDGQKPSMQGSTPQSEKTEKPED